MEDKNNIEEEETIDAVTPAEEVNEAEELEVEESTEEESEEPDYNAILEDEKAKAERNRKGYEMRKGKREDISAIVSEQVKEQVSAIRQELLKDTFENELVSLSKNEAEQNLIRHFYDNKIVKSGFTRDAIKEDLQAAYLLANAKKFQKKAKETSEALNAKNSMGNSGGSNLDKPKVKQDLSKMFSKNDWEFMQKRGWDEAKIKKAAENIRN